MNLIKTITLENTKNLTVRGYVAEIPPWLGRKARNDETKSNRGTKSRNVHDN